MLKDNIELAENKLLLLYLLDKTRIPMTQSHITQIVLENNLLNYFQLQQYLSELVDGGFVADNKSENKHLMSMTASGVTALNFFTSRIPDKKKEIIDNYFKSHAAAEKKIDALCNYKFENNIYTVNLKLIENNTPLIEINLTAGSKEQCDMICSSWKENPKKIYSKILSTIIQQ